MSIAPSSSCESLHRPPALDDAVANVGKSRKQWRHSRFAPVQSPRQRSIKRPLVARSGLHLPRALERGGRRSPTSSSACTSQSINEAKDTHCVRDCIQQGLDYPEPLDTLVFSSRCEVPEQVTLERGNKLVFLSIEDGACSTGAGRRHGGRGIAIEANNFDQTVAKELESDDV
jgi:hypothetical protein